MCTQQLQPECRCMWGRGRACRCVCVGVYTLIFLVSGLYLFLWSHNIFSHLLLLSSLSLSCPSLLPLPPSWLLLWGFSGCIFPVFLSPIQCNFLFINIWFPLSELSSALRPTRSRGLVKKKRKKKEKTHARSSVYLTSPSPLFWSSSALYLLSSLLLTLSISRAPAKCGLCLLPDIRPSACITFPLWQPTANWPTPLLVTVAYVSRAFQSSAARI